MSRNKGTFNISANFEPLVKAPFDARTKVNLYSDLIDPSAWTDSNGNVWLYDGATVSVSNDASISKNGLYFLANSSSYINQNSWTKILSNSDISIGNTSCRILKDFYTDVSTSGTGETDLYSYPTFQLVDDGDKLEFEYSINNTGTAATGVYIKNYFAGNYFTIVSNQNFYGSSTAALTIKCTIIRTSSTTALLRITLIGFDSYGICDQGLLSLTSLDFTISNILKVTGQCATNSITAKFGYIEYKPGII